MSGLIEARWEQFRKTVLGNITNPIQIEEMRKAYFSGCLDMMFFNLQITALPESLGVLQMEAAYQELNAFGKSMGVLADAMERKKP